MTFRLLITATFFLISHLVHADTESSKLKPLAHFDKYSRVGYNDIWGYTDPAGREFALLGLVNGLSVIDINDTANLREIAYFPGQDSSWRDIKTYKHYAYVVNESGGGMQIIDLSQLPQKATLAATYTGFQTSHNLYIDEDTGLLFAEGTDAMPVRILSLADPVQPKQIATLGVECHDIYARNGMLFVSEGGHGTIGVFDYTDPAHPKFKYRFEIPNAGYVHNAWQSDDGDYLMTTEETTNKTIKMWDIRNPSKVKLVGEYLAGNGLAHNTHIKGNYAYISHYGSGLRIVDISNPTNLREVAHFQKPGATPRGFKGAWGAFPFFASGKVLLSEIETGLYVLEHHP